MADLQIQEIIRTMRAYTKDTSGHDTGNARASSPHTTDFSKTTSISERYEDEDESSEFRPRHLSDQLIQSSPYKSSGTLEKAM